MSGEGLSNRASSMATSSLVLGCVSIACWIVFALLVGLAFGLVEQNPEDWEALRALTRAGPLYVVWVGSLYLGSALPLLGLKDGIKALRKGLIGRHKKYAKAGVVICGIATVPGVLAIIALAALACHNAIPAQ